MPDVVQLRSVTTPAFERHLPGEPGIWIMIFGDMLMFSIMFAVFLFYRRADLPLFESSQAHLDQTLGLINTFFMLTSSWFVAMAVQAARAHRTRTTVIMFRLALACGAGFSVVKVVEYTEKIRAGIVINTNDFYTYYFVFTGIHFLHVLIGMGVLAFMGHYASDGQFSKTKVGHIESGASFWHVVDLLWIALFALLYLLRQECIIRARRITLVWLALVAATLISWGFGHGRRMDRQAAGIAVIIIAFLKIRYVLLDFMELRSAPLVMRVAAEAWCIVVCCTLIALYSA